jgi:hypothetical protein
MESGFNMPGFQWFPRPPIEPSDGSGQRRKDIRDIKDFNHGLISYRTMGAHDPNCWKWLGSSPLVQGRKDKTMGETHQFKNFRIWAALGVALLYMLLAASGNA